MLTRGQFADYFNSLKDGFGNTDSPLWCAEDNTICQYFVCVKPLALFREAHKITKDVYWDWCNANLKGKTLCYSSDYENKQEWWGFTNKDDIVLWMLKWM